MPIKPAKVKYTREEVLEILQRNVELYKDEPGFTEYFVQLALYMMDKAANPEALIPATTPLPIQFDLRKQGGHQKASDPPVAFSRTKTPVGHQPQGDDAHPQTPAPPGRPFRPTAPPPPRNFSGDGNPLPSTPRPSHT
ncbi:MAG: hypothetical protein JJU11_07450, partial [Candidatus Sumerlaeia bacterium]|nr:hypothetical protein [Candidatus Sumerlaeia bacterium]